MTSSGMWLSAKAVACATLAAQKTLINDMTAQAESEARKMVKNSQGSIWQRPWGLSSNISYARARPMFVDEFSKNLYQSYHYSDLLRMHVAAEAAVEMVDDGKIFMSIDDFAFINKYFAEA